VRIGFYPTSPALVHAHPTHLIRAWSGEPTDEAPLCGSCQPEAFMHRTTGRRPWDCAGNPMPLCPQCVAVDGAEKIERIRETRRAYRAEMDDDGEREHMALVHGDGSECPDGCGGA
jgi:hypothetical protein